MVEESPLDDVIGVVRLTDREVRQALLRAERDAARILSGNVGDVRRAQLQLAALNVEMWKSVKDATTVGIGDAFDAHSAWQARFDFDLLRRIGQASSHWEQSMLATGRAGLENYLARAQGNPFSLSQMVYKGGQRSIAEVNKMVDSALLLGLSASELASQVRKYINPNVPGGVSYAANRLARTEVVNAYHEAAKQRYKSTPWVENVKWNLSGSHPVPDECNEYAEAVTFRGGKAGEWKPDAVPNKPHPQCLCFLTPVAESLDEFARKFKNGEYDDYVDEVMGCQRV